jgi:hypothetical protein
MSAVRRMVVCVTILARDRRIPRPLRGAAAVGLLPLPGPFDEAVLLLVAIPLLIFYRQPMREAWQQAEARGMAARPVREDPHSKSAPQ